CGRVSAAMATTTTRWNDSPVAAHAERPHIGRRWARLRLRRQAVRGSRKHNYATRRCAMTLPYDDHPKFTAYAHPERLVSTSWLAEHLGSAGLVVVESDEDVLLYETGHIPGAVKVDWHTELNDQVTRDYVDGAGFAALMSAKG